MSAWERKILPTLPHESANKTIKQYEQVITREFQKPANFGALN